jgi:hypothetical protein
MEPNAIADLLERVIAGDPWHGPSVRQTLSGVTADTAARPGPNGAHGIWTLVLHMTGWTREVTARLRGRAAQEPAEGDFPEIGEPTEERWRAAQLALFAAHDELAATVRHMDAARLGLPVLDYRDGAAGSGRSHYVTLHGLVHHTVHHAGQIALLKRLFD